MTPKRLGSVHPFVVVLDRLLSFRVICISKVALAITHDQELGHALIGSTRVHLPEIRGILGLIFEERVDILDRIESHRPGFVCEIQIVYLSCEEEFVQ